MVYPTFYDPCALVTLEALACGVPVVTTRRNGAAELIRDGHEGFVIDHPRDVPALAARLQMLGDEAVRARMREAAAETGKRLSFDTHLDRLVTLLSGRPSTLHGTVTPGPPGARDADDVYEGWIAKTSA